jgi:CMP-N,N'-diacetyllegionaminic acid synthase
MKKVLCIIPARKASKGLPKKNIKNFFGKPLLAWSIELALKVELIDDVVVSTDCAETAEISVKYGAKVPFLRPGSLSRDDSSTIDVLLHAIDFLAASGDVYEYVILLEPTSPLRDLDDVTGALDLCTSFGFEKSVVSVAPVQNFHPRFMFRCSNDLQEHLIPYLGDYPSNLRRQDVVDHLYIIEGSVYISPVYLLKKHKTFYHGNTIPWIVDYYKHFEIDNAEDAVIVESLMKRRISGTK